VEFEEKTLKGDNRRLLIIECIKAREKEKGSKRWIEEREVFYRQNGFSTKGIKDVRERGGNVKDIIRRIERDRMGQWLEQRIKESNYNDRYKNSTSIGMPDSLLKRRERGSQKIIARWKCGNEEERNGFWKTEEEKNAAYAEWKKDV